MNTFITSKEAILEIARKIVQKEGIQALNMRKVAQESQIALGTLYNYFSNKEDLIICTVESIWKEIFHTSPVEKENSNFIGYLAMIYNAALDGCRNYPGFLNGHSISIASNRKGDAISAMHHSFLHMKMHMEKALQADQKIKADVFSDSFSKDEFLGFILDNMLSTLVKGEDNCSFLLKVVSRILYE